MTLTTAWRALAGRSRTKPRTCTDRLRADYDRRVRAAQRLALATGAPGHLLAWERIYDARARFLARRALWA